MEQKQLLNAEAGCRNLPFLHRLCNTAIGPNSWERGKRDRSVREGGSSIFTMSITRGLIACSPTASEFVSGRTLDDARYAYSTEPMRKES